MSNSNDAALNTSAQPQWMTIAGWICTCLVVFALVASSSFKFMTPSAEILKELEKSGLDPKLLVPIGIIEVACALIYLFPRTAVVGAVLVAGYMGGAIFSHVRLHDYMVVPHVIIGMMAWLGIYLREPRLRPIMFWR